MTDTHCPYCALQCAMTVSAGHEVQPREFPTNRGGLCQKGWISASVLTTPGRLTTPLVRVDGELRSASWDDALDFVASKITELQAEHGKDSIAVFGSGGLTNEKAYSLGKFARVALGTSNIDYNGRFCMSSAAAASNRAFGVDRGLPFPVTDLDDADVVLLIGANPAETMPPFMQHFTKAELIVVDPRLTATAEQAKLHLQAAPGTDLALALGILHAVVESDRQDREYLAIRTVGFEEAWQIAATWWPERAERVTGVPANHIRKAAKMLAQAKNAYILTARGTEQHANGTDTTTSWINLALALGLVGREGSGWGCITGQGNGQGGREHGQKADQLPGYRKLANQQDREYIAKIWQINADELPGVGVSAYELLDSLGTDDGPKAMLVFGSNPVISAPRAKRITQRIKDLDLLVVADFVLSETAALADVVFPVTQWAEETGTMTNLEGRLLLRQQALTPPEGVRSDLDVLQGLAKRLGRDGFPTDPETVFDELRLASSGGISDYYGVTYDRLRAGEALHWPVPNPNHPGTPRLFLDEFAHADGRARLVPVDFIGLAEPVNAEFPLCALTGRVLQHYQSGAQTRLVAELRAAVPEAYVEVHPDTAKRYKLANGDQATVQSRRGAMTARVRYVTSMQLDTVFIPFHFPGEGAANIITSDALDPISKMPEFKVCAVRFACDA
jgi:assimilatory nitrate reductase catalytic subunit